MLFPLRAVALDTDIVILGVQDLSIGKPGGPFYYLAYNFVSLGTPWETMGAAGRARGGLGPDVW